MVKYLSTLTRGELIRALKERYMESSKKENRNLPSRIEDNPGRGSSQEHKDGREGGCPAKSSSRALLISVQK